MKLSELLARLDQMEGRIERLEKERSHLLAHLQHDDDYVFCRECVNDGLIPLKGVY